MWMEFGVSAVQDKVFEKGQELSSGSSEKGNNTDH